MPLSRCPEPECNRILDVPEIQASWRCPDGRCAGCNNLSAEELKAMKLPEEIIKTHAPEVAKLLYPQKKGDTSTDKPKRTYVKRVKNVGKVEAGVPLPGDPKVEVGVPLPGTKRTSAYPFEKLQPPKDNGDMYSFFVKATSSKNEDIRKLADSISSSAYTYRKKHKKVAFAVRRVGDGVRCWRIK